MSAHKFVDSRSPCQITLYHKNARCTGSTLPDLSVALQIGAEIGNMDSIGNLLHTISLDLFPIQHCLWLPGGDCVFDLGPAPWPFKIGLYHGQLRLSSFDQCP